MTKQEHLLTIIEPIPGGDTTLDLAHETVVRGGTATVVVVVTDRAERAIKHYAETAGIGVGEAEAITFSRLRTQCHDRTGDVQLVIARRGSISSDVVQYITANTTAVAIPASLVTDKLVERIATYSGRPVIVAPYRVPELAA